MLTVEVNCFEISQVFIETNVFTNSLVKHECHWDSQFEKIPFELWLLMCNTVICAGAPTWIHMVYSKMKRRKKER